MSTQKTRHSNWILAAFAAPCLPMAALGLPLVVHLPHFFASTIGIPLATVTAVFLAVKLLDIVADPILGSLMDRTRTKLGRFKPWMLLSIVMLALATYMVFMPPGLKAGPIYLTGWLLLIYVGFSVAVLGQTAWASVLSPDYDERSRIYGFWTLGNVVGILLVLLLPVIVTSQGGTQAQGVAAMGWFIIVLLPITIGLAVWRVPEPVPQKPSHGKMSDYFDFLKLKSVRRLMWTDLLFGLAPGITGTLALYYFRSAKDMSEFEANLLIFGYFAAGLVGAGLWTVVAKKIGKHKAMSLAGVLFAVAYLGVAFAPAGNFPLQLASMIGVGIPFCANQVLLRAMLSDIGDEDRLKSGEDRTGMLFALMTATNKIGYALAVLTFYPLAMVGFVKEAGAPQTDEALTVLSVLFVGLPIVLLLLASWVIFSFPLDRAKQEEIRAALEARDGVA